jgi:hypothetical protein
MVWCRATLCGFFNQQAAAWLAAPYHAGLHVYVTSPLALHAAAAAALVCCRLRTGQL